MRVPLWRGNWAHDSTACRSESLAHSARHLIAMPRDHAQPKKWRNSKSTQELSEYHGSQWAGQVATKMGQRVRDDASAQCLAKTLCRRVTHKNRICVNLCSHIGDLNGSK